MFFEIYHTSGYIVKALARFLQKPTNKNFAFPMGIFKRIGFTTENMIKYNNQMSGKIIGPPLRGFSRLHEKKHKTIRLISGGHYEF
jgi:hypothetical protein